ncbi:hypothetical protein DERF_002807 [Dermatophagoides farinae]|uniref:Uncharacterized protein n=1 Tax=Dermatophagoides farinae TaxID=6954 RepID=A0A922IG58_DERFA|nr:uncharacterized protein LOC124491487 [Dermatophagoides farinae]KAH7641870.1 hypothetical protein HUG17_4915 [Dermatophagoides farinae]KAH9528899.1 hypothetical protein DERF_002807 [Dermatophagoides farinae]
MHYLNIETLPLILYFGSVSLLSLMYGVLKFFQKYQHRRRNKQERNDVDDNEEKHTIKRDRKCSLQQLEQQQSEKKSRFTKWFWNMFIKLRLTNNNHKHVYFPSEQEKRFGIASQTAQQQQQQNTNSYVDITGHDQELTNSTHANITPTSSKVDLSSLESNNPDDDRSSIVTGGVKSRKHPHYQQNSLSQSSCLLEESGSLTRVVITEIEQHQFQRNREIDELNQQQHQKHLEQPDEKNTCIKFQNQNKLTENEKMVVKKIPLHVINNNKLNAAFDFLENETDSDPIYDVPSSRSLINLIDVTEVNLPAKQQQRGHNNNGEIIAYYHTSTPNLLSIKSGVNIKTNANDFHGDYHYDDDEESIYDTPKSRSFVA